MDSNHMNATSVIGMPNSAPASKLKSGSNMSSPGNGNFNNCTKSPLSGNFNNGRRSASPFFSDAKSEDIMPKNGGCLMSGSSLPILHGGNYPDPTASPPGATSQNTLPSATSQTKRESSKMSANPSSDLRNASVALIGLPQSNDGKGNTASSKREIAQGRSEKRVQLNHAVLGEKHRNATLTRTLSNNFLRHNSTDCGKESIGSTMVKSKDKSSSRQSPRAASDFLNDHSGRHLGGYESPTISYPSPSSSENALTTTTVARSKTKGHERGPGTPVASTGPSHMSNHLSRTSSSNSVSDLSRCSEVTDESGQADGGNIVPSTSSESMHAHISYSPTATSHVDMESTISYQRFENSAIVNALAFPDEDHSSATKQNTQINLEGANASAIGTDEVLPTDNSLNLDFQFPDGASGQADLGQKALNLSAEDIRQTLNSVSAESGLPDLGSDSAVFDDQAMQLINNGTGYDMTPSSESFSSADANRVLSPSVTAVSATASTSPTTSIVTSAVSSATTTMPSSASNMVPAGKPFGNESFSGAVGGPGFSSSQSTTPSSTTPVSFSPTTGPHAAGKSHLQEILGVTDTNRLKNMARPVDSAQFPSTTTTSFSSNILNQPGQVMPNSTTGPVQNLPSTRYHRIPSGGNAYQRHPVHQRTPNTYGGPPHSPLLFDSPNMNPGAPNYMEHNMSPRSNMPFDPNMAGPHHPHPGGPGSNMPPYHNMWPRPSSMGMVPPIGPGGDGSKSPRGAMGPGVNFPNRSVNPMSALQGTVNAISEGFSSSQGIGSMTKNNNNNMGPPNAFQGMPPSSGMGDFPMCSPVGRTMLPPPSPSVDKRSFSGDGTLSSTTVSKKSNKRERGQSVDSKDGDKQSAPKSKRRKSKSKDESKKTSAAETKALSRSNSVSDTQGNSQLMYIFNSEMANMAANVVNQGKSPTIVSYHQTSHRSCRMVPSKPGNLTGNSAGPILSKSPSQQPGDQNHGYPSSGRPIKTEANLTSPRPSVKDDGKSRGHNIKTEFNQSGDGKHMSPSLPKQEATEENLSEEQKHHREEALSKLRSIGAMLDGNSNPGPVPPPNNGRWQSGSAGNDYSMSLHLQEIQKNKPVSATSMGSHVPAKEAEWLRLVKAYNEHKRRNRKPDASPPPYAPNGPRPRWMGPGVHDPNGPIGPPHDLMRYPQMAIRAGTPGRMPFDGPRIPSSYMGPRMPRGFIGPGGSRMQMYHGPGIPPGGPKIPRQSIPHLQQPPHLGHGHGHPNEAYPFSEKLKEKASMYRTEGMHGPLGGNMPFDMNNPDGPMGPEWAGPYANPGSVPPGGRLAHMPETVSPSHGPIPGSMMTSVGPVPGPMMDNNLPPGREPMSTPGGGGGMDSSGLRMTNPNMIPPTLSYSNKGPNALPNYTDSPMPGMPPSMGGPMEMHPGAMGVMNMTADRNGGRMKDAMERRGEPRPPDLKINPAVPGSPSMAFSGGRHPAHSPRVAHSAAIVNQQQFMHADMGPGGLPQVSPHHPSVRSPMMSPGAPNQYMQMGQGGMPHQVGPMDHPNMMPHNAPLSADRGPPSDWGPMPPSSMVPPRTPSSSGMMHSGQGPRPPSAITEMINKMSTFPISMQSPLYQDAVKDTSPPPLTHVNGSNMIDQEPPPLTHPNQHGEPQPVGMQVMGGHMARTPTGNMMPQPMPGGGAPPGYDPGMSGPRPTGPRHMGPPPMGDGYGGEYRPPSHPDMCMSPSTMHASQQGMMPPVGGMDMPGNYPMQQHGNMMPPGPGGYHPPPPSGMMHGAPPSGGGCPQPRGIPEFDLTHIIPREKPSETLSYFPSGGGGGGGGQDASQSQVDPNPRSQMNVTSPTMQPRYPNTSMGQRPMHHPGNFPSAGSGNPMMRPSVPGNFGGPNPPSYPPDPHMGGQWEMASMVRPPMMQNSGPGMHSGYPGSARPLI